MNYVSESITHLIADNPEHPNVFDGEIYDKVSVTVSVSSAIRVKNAKLRQPGSNRKFELISLLLLLSWPFDLNRVSGFF